MKQGKYFSVIGSGGPKGSRLKDNLILVPHGHWAATAETRNLSGANVTYAEDTETIEARFRERAVIVSRGKNVAVHPVKFKTEPLSGFFAGEDGKRVVTEECLFVSTEPFAILIEREYRPAGNIAQVLGHLVKTRFTRRLTAARQIRVMDLWNETSFAKFKAVPENDVRKGEKLREWSSLAWVSAAAEMPPERIIKGFLVPPLFSLPDGYVSFVIAKSEDDIAKGEYLQIHEVPEGANYTPEEIWVAEPIARGILQLIRLGLKDGNSVLHRYVING
jgi:hypothetical protein